MDNENKKSFQILLAPCPITNRHRCEKETILCYVSQYGSVKARDARESPRETQGNRRLYKGLIIVKTAISRVFVIYNFHQKILSEPYCSHTCFIELL